MILTLVKQYAVILFYIINDGIVHNSLTDGLLKRAYSRAGVIKRIKLSALLFLHKEVGTCYLFYFYTYRIVSPLSVFYFSK